MKKGFKFLGLFLLSIIGFTSFSSAGSYTYNGTANFNTAYNKFSITLPIPVDLHNSVYLTCVFNDVSNLSPGTTFYIDTIGINASNGLGYSSNGLFALSNGGSFSTTINTSLLSSSFGVGLRCQSETCRANLSYTCTFTGVDLVSCPQCEECETCPEVDTGSILSGYVAISDIDMNYCVSNDLCPEMSGGYSALYINDIRHESMPFINITIPEEFNWDYSYTGNNTQFDLNIIGYNTDSDYIAGIINTQNSKPNSTDFNNIVSGLIPLLIPGLVILLFIWFVFKFIKKIF